MFDDPCCTATAATSSAESRRSAARFPARICACPRDRAARRLVPLYPVSEPLWVPRRVSAEYCRWRCDRVLPQARRSPGEAGHASQWIVGGLNPGNACRSRVQTAILGGTGVNLSDPGEDVWGSCPTGLITTDGTATTAH